MLIKTDTITRGDLLRTLADVNPRLVLECEEKGSTTHARAFKVGLSFDGEKARGDGRYRKL